MRLRDLLLAILSTGLITIGLFGQDSPVNKGVPPGNLQLLGGYTWTSGRTTDAMVGKMVHDSGFSIFYDRSAVRGFFNRKFSDKSNLEWSQSQTVNGQTLDIARFKNQELAGYFDDTTRFSSKPTSYAEIAEFLLTLMTFSSSPYTRQPDARTPIPGNIKLLPGYTHESLRGKDSRPGKIFKPEGLSIGYDIGRMAGLRAAKFFPENLERLRKQTHLNAETIAWQIMDVEDKIAWRQRQKINGFEVLVVQLKDSTIIVTFLDSSANFFAKVTTEQDLVDFLLTTLTYQPPERRK